MERDMATNARYLAIGATILIVFGLACEQNKFQPPTTPGPITPAPAGLVRLELIAPESIAPGASVQLTANATRADNSVENVSPQAVWMSQDPRVVEMSSTGAARGVGRGEAVIRSYYAGWSASTRTFVLPEGTYRLDGRVTDTGMGVAGVTVTVMGSVGGDLTTITDEEGRYWLYGVRDRVRLQAKGAGYLDRIEEVDVAGHRSFDLQITAEHERADLRGHYRLTLYRGPCASTPVPDIRSYDASVTQHGPRLTVVLSGADFIVTRGRGNAFSGFIDGGNRVTFAIGDPSDEYHYGPYDLVERIDDARALIVSGSVTADLSSTGISGTLRGAFLLSATVEPFVRIHACYGTAHRFEMVRR
jgi:hypothetical protein